MASAESRQRLRESVLDGATELFVAHGYHATTIAALSDATGASLATIYSIFDSKDDVLLAVIDREATQDQRSLDRALSAVTVADGLAGALAGWLTSDFGFDRVLLPIELTLHARGKPDLAKRLTERRRRVHNATIDTLRPHLGRLGMAPVLDDVVALLWGLGEGLSIRQVVGNDADPHALLTRVLDRCLGPGT